MAGRKLSSVSDKTEILNFKIDADSARLFKAIVEKEGLSTSEALRSIVKRYTELKGRLMVRHDSFKE